MEAEYNESQMSAVTAGLDRSPVVLIQACFLTWPHCTPSACCHSVNPCNLGTCTHCFEVCVSAEPSKMTCRWQTTFVALPACFAQVSLAFVYDLVTMVVDCGAGPSRHREDEDNSGPAVHHTARGSGALRWPHQARPSSPHARVRDGRRPPPLAQRRPLARRQRRPQVTYCLTVICKHLILA